MLLGSVVPDVRVLTDARTVLDVVGLLANREMVAGQIKAWVAASQKYEAARVAHDERERQLLQREEQITAREAAFAEREAEIGRRMEQVEASARAVQEARERLEGQTATLDVLKANIKARMA
jgi:hypothetical protein